MPVAAQSPPPISDLAFLPGDAAVGFSPEQQIRPAIAAGGPGFLVVWQEMRTALSGTTNTPYNGLGGNGWDIYGARLDSDGNLLDASPILITQEGHNQEDPQLAWNGENWLVVWTRERNQWYFDLDSSLRARVSPSGALLDATPIPIRPDGGSNWSAWAPAVASDGGELARRLGGPGGRGRHPLSGARGDPRLAAGIPDRQPAGDPAAVRRPGVRSAHAACGVRGRRVPGGLDGGRAGRSPLPSFHRRPAGARRAAGPRLERRRRAPARHRRRRLPDRDADAPRLPRLPLRSGPRSGRDLDRSRKRLAADRSRSPPGTATTGSSLSPAAPTGRPSRATRRSTSRASTAPAPSSTRRRRGSAPTTKTTTGRRSPAPAEAVSRSRGRRWPAT